MAADVEVPIADRNNILYDFTIQAEWQCEPEFVFRPTREKSQVTLAGRVALSASRSLWTFFRTVGLPVRTGSPCALPPGLLKLVGVQMNWMFAVTNDGRQVAVLQDQLLEIRTWRDDYNSTFSKWLVPKDSYSQWRTLAWSSDGDMIAVSDSTGSVRVYDIMGAPICIIESVSNSASNLPVDLSRAVCGLIFKDCTNKDRGNHEIYVFNYQGLLKKYIIHHDGQAVLQHMFTFASFYTHGISAVVYNAAHSLLLVGGCAEAISQDDSSPPSASHLGITAWRILSDTPYYKLVTDYEEDKRTVQRKSRLLRNLRNLYTWKYEEQDGIYKLCLSPNGQILAAIHQSGALTLLDVPSLRIRRTWTQDKQPNYNEVDISVAENPKLRKYFKDQLGAFFLVDINWWSDQEVILARGTGAVTVSCVKTLENLLGPSPEWFKGTPQLSMSNGGGFLGLECESKFSHPKRPQRESDDNYIDSEDEEDVAFIPRMRKYVKHVLHFVTDNERFQPPRKRPRLVTKSYRLVWLKSTTPEELYARKIDLEEYGEALALAKAYHLDCDLVYQRRWRKTPVSVASIQDYLSKIGKRSWVLHECLERVPENIDAMRELLQFGLRGTDLEALLAIDSGEDGGRFIECDRSDVYNESIDVFNPEEVEASKEKQKQYLQNLLDQVDFSSLTLEQKELCRVRRKLLQYLNRLSTYEEILGGSHYAADRYDKAFFENFRSRNVVELATQYARDCDWQALDTIFTYHGSQTLPHRLAILSNFPETCPPRSYISLLPQVQSGSVRVWHEETWRDPDWCEAELCTLVLDVNTQDPGAFLYEDNTDLQKFSGAQLTIVQLSEWYKYRACEIESRSRQVDLALSLVTIAKEEKNIEGLDDLYDDLVTMDTMVYECMVDDSLTFKHLLEMPNIDRLRLIMSKSSEEMYSKNIWRWLVPFLERCDKRTPGSYMVLLREYLTSMAKVDLTLCLKIFECCRPDTPRKVVSDVNEVISMALECVYICHSTDQLSTSYSIMECLPQREFGVVSVQSSLLHDKIDELECHLGVAEILEKHEIPQPICYIRDSQANYDETRKLFIKLTRVAGRKENGPSESRWKELLNDVLALREKVYKCISPAECYQIFVESLLCSSDMKSIMLARRMIERSEIESREPDYSLSDLDDKVIIHKVAYKKAVELVLSAASEYFDSSAHLTDPSMELAKACLGLIEDRPAVVQVELDLIDALALLDAFGVNILPLQVRMCNDRLQLVQKAINEKPFTYKNLQRLLKLGRLLGIPGTSDSVKDSKVLQLVAQKALKVQDYVICHKSCQTLMALGCPEAWRECKALAEAEDFHDIPAKTELLSYAVIHCTPDLIENILRAKCLLETQSMYERVHSRVADRDSQSPTENPFTARGALEQTKEILSTTNKATRKVLSIVSDNAWWKKTLKSLKPKFPARSISQSDDLNDNMLRQGCHPFYESLITDSYTNRSEVDYERMCGSRTDISGLHFSECLLYTSKLEEMLSYGAHYHSSQQVLHQLSHDALPVDSALGLAYLLTLPCALDAESTFEKMPGSAISLQLAAYYYAIQIHSLLDTSTPLCVKATYQYSPSDLIQRITSHVSWKEKNQKSSEWSDDLRALVAKLKHYNELLLDYNQAQTLAELDRGIDIGRFTVDPEYKKETILGLSMTTEDKVYGISVSLATRYGVPLWEVYMNHLEFLFESGISTEAVMSRVKQLNILPTLQADQAVFYERLSRYVYPGIAGNDHDRLMLYYMLLENCYTSDPITPKTHVKLLRQIANTAPGLDYKHLTGGEHDPLDVLRPVLTSDNINVLAKLTAKLPDKVRGGCLNQSVVYCGWALQTFWQGKGKTSDKTDWIQRVDACDEYLQQLIPEDVIRFSDQITFVPTALKELPVDCRRQVVRRILKYCKQQLTARKQKTTENMGPVSWETAVQHMQRSMEHLDKLSNPVIARLRQSDSQTLNKYAELFDLSQGHADKLEVMYITMVLDGQCPEMVDDVMSLTPLEGWTSSTAFTRAVGLIIKALRGEDITMMSGRDVMAVLRLVCTEVGNHQKDGGELARSDDLVVILRPFCADSTVPIESRLETLKTLEECFSLGDEDLVLLTLYRTEAVVSSSWPDKQLKEQDIATGDRRLQLFRELLSASEQLNQFQSIIKLLHVWPPFDISSDLQSHPWCVLLCKMLQTCGSPCTGDLIATLQELLKKQMPENLLVLLHEESLSCDLPIPAIKCLLLSEDGALHERAVSVLKPLTTTDDMDTELLDLICRRLLVSNVVDTVIYPLLVDHILANQQPGGAAPYHLSAETVANQLVESGYEVEAGSLLMMHRGMHPALRTFDAALSAINHWLNR